MKKEIVFDDPYLRKNLINDEDNTLYNIKYHYEYIKNIYLGEDFEHKKCIIKELKKKYSSYKSQDKLKNKFDQEQHITFNELIQKLYDCDLKCYYCTQDLLLVYKNKNETRQWSLERFDNNIGHYCDNTCISCLECNLKRRTSNHEYFKMGKQMTIRKI